MKFYINLKDKPNWLSEYSKSKESVPSTWKNILELDNSIKSTVKTNLNMALTLNGLYNWNKKLVHIEKFRQTLYQLILRESSENKLTETRYITTCI